MESHSRSNCASSLHWPDMDTMYPRNALQYSFVHHQFSSSKPLLSGLEEEEDRTAQALLPLLQELGSCIQSAKVASILASEQRREALSMAAFFHLLPCPTTLLKAKAGVRSTDMEQPCT